MAAPNHQAHRSVFDDIRDMLYAYKQEIPRSLQDDADIREIVLLFDNAQTKHVAALREASDMLLFGKTVADSMTELIVNMQEVSSTASALPNHIIRQLEGLRKNVYILRQRSQSCAENFDKVAATIQDDLQRITNIQAKFERRFIRTMFMIDVALGVCRIIVEICGIVAGCGIPAVSPAMAGGRFLGKLMQKRLQPAKERLQEKHKKLEEVEAALREQLRCVRDLGAWWLEIESDLNRLWDEVFPATQVGPSLPRTERLQELHLRWTQKQDNMS